MATTVAMATTATVLMETIADTMDIAMLMILVHLEITIMLLFQTEHIMEIIPQIIQVLVFINH